MKTYLILLFCGLSFGVSAQSAPGLIYDIKGIAADSASHRAQEVLKTMMFQTVFSNY